MNIFHNWRYKYEYFFAGTLSNNAMDLIANWKDQHQAPNICFLSKARSTENLIDSAKRNIVCPDIKEFYICSRYNLFCLFFWPRSGWGVALCRRWGAKIGGEVGVITRGDVPSSIFHLDWEKRINSGLVWVEGLNISIPTDYFPQILQIREGMFHLPSSI